MRTLKIEGDLLTPISIFKRLKGRKKCLLESSLKHLESGRYSFIGLNPYKQIFSFGDQTTVKSNLKEEKVEGKALNILKEQLPEMNIKGSFPFYSGAVGFIGYDVIRQHEFIGPDKENETAIPDLHFLFYQDIIVFDHISQEVHIVCTSQDGRRTKEDLENELHAIKKMVATPEEEDEAVSSPIEFVPEINKKEFEQRVQKAKEHIVNGDIFQVVLSQRLSGKFNGNAFALYRKLRKTNPSPYMFYLDFEDYVVLGSSPESFIKLKDSKLTTNPIAGTRPRGETREKDALLEKELLNDEKEIAEHKMLVDLGRNDIGRVCEVGSIKIPKFMAIERYKYVMHIVSEVSGTLKNDLSGVDALISCLPAGTVSGAPKIRAMQIINDLEDTKRGVYSGAIGYINANGDMDFALTIRTMVVKDQKAYVQAGAGIVYDSNPESEYQETLNKAKALLEVAK
ncbi:anthranilate synthase component I [Falsibacillus albus]|uniref:Anthranilate synthase component 1 n=2 Tax=Falsibacillus albus TaxID=2478915 RepID=A0A3L7JYF3_9BACI|nr:anthranilate synthase component I [Falsibacillus albus]